MPDRRGVHTLTPQNTADAWINAVLSAWEDGGHAAISARALAQVTGLPNSSIFNYFGSLERLYVSAQEAAMASASAWCDRRREELADTPSGPESLPAIMAALIDDWCERERRTALAWRECQLLAARKPGFVKAAADWRAIWDGFWQELCNRLGIPGAGLLTARIFDGESFFHLLRWRRPVDRAALDELCGGWSAWLNGEPAPLAPWREIARAHAAEGNVRVEPRDNTAIRIADAAAALLGRDGIAGITHRAVAAEAGLTLGVVSHKMRTSADLLNSAFESIYWRGVISTEKREDMMVLDQDRAALVAGFVKWPGSDEYRLARAELMVAAMRDPALAAFAARLRYLRGGASGRLLQALLGNKRRVSALDASVFASFVNGQRNAHAGMEEEERQACSAREIAALLSVFGSAR